MEDWSGDYISIKPSNYERALLLLKYKGKRFRYAPAKLKKVFLFKDSTYKEYEIVMNGDTIFKEGKWELYKNKPRIIYETHITDFKFSGYKQNIYYEQTLIDCKDTTSKTLRIGVFKKLD